MLNEIMKENGFLGINEFNEMVASIDISTTDKLNKFKVWQNNDGTKEGLIQLMNESKSEELLTNVNHSSKSKKNKTHQVIFEDIFYQKLNSSSQK